MAGIVGFVSREPWKSYLDGALDCLRHGPSFESESYVDGPGLGLGVCHRSSGRARHAWAPESGIGAVLYGWAVARNGATAVVDPGWIVDAYREHGVVGLMAMDGDFLYDSMRDEQVHEAEDRAADYERELQDG